MSQKYIFIDEISRDKIAESFAYFSSLNSKHLFGDSTQQQHNMNTITMVDWSE